MHRLSSFISNTLPLAKTKLLREDSLTLIITLTVAGGWVIPLWHK